MGICAFSKRIQKVLKRIDTTKLIYKEDAGMKGKPSSFNIFAVDNTIIYNISEIAGRGNKLTALESLQRIITNGENYKKVRNLTIEIDNAYNMLLAPLGSLERKYHEGKTLDEYRVNRFGNNYKQKAVGMYHVFSAMVSEQNIMETRNISPDNMMKLRNGDNNLNLNKAQIALAIGQSLMKHEGVRMQTSSTNQHIIYTEIGYDVLNKLEAEGLITSSKPGESVYVVNNGMFDEDGKKINGEVVLGQAVWINHEKFNTNKKGKSIIDPLELQELVHSEDLDAMKKYPYLRHTIMASSLIKRITSPTNEYSPFTENDEETVTLKSGKTIIKQKLPPLTTTGLGSGTNRFALPQEMKDLVRELQKGKTYINPEAAFMLSLINKQYKHVLDVKENRSVAAEQTVRKIVSAMFPSLQNKQRQIIVNRLFGGYRVSPEDNIETEMGRAASRQTPFIQAVDNIGTYFKSNDDGTSTSISMLFPLNFYGTGRMEYRNTWMNIQSDKHFGRPMSEGKAVKIRIGELEQYQLLAGMMDTFGLSKNEIIKRGTNIALDKFIDYYEEAFIKNGHNETKAMHYMESIGLGVLKLSNEKKTYRLDIDGSAWVMHQAIKTIYEYRKGIENGVIETAFRTNPDASVSGLMISAAQGFGKNVGSDDKISEDEYYQFFRDLGFLAETPDDKMKLKDAYHLMIRQAEHFDDKEKYDSKGIMDELAKETPFFGSDVDVALRTLSKVPTMTKNYMAGNLTAALESAKEYREMIINFFDLSKSKTAGEELQGINYIANELLDGDEVEEYTRKVLSETDIKKLEQMKTLSKTTLALDGIAIINMKGINNVIENWLLNKVTTPLVLSTQKSLGFTEKYKSRIINLYNNIDSIISETNNDLKSGNPSITLKDTIPFMILPAAAYMFAEDEEVESFSNSEQSIDSLINNRRKFLRKYGMPLTSMRQVYTQMNNGKYLINKAMVPNSLIPLVNAIHSIDSAIFFLAHKKAREAIKEEIKNAESDYKESLEISLDNAPGMVHDANYADAVYNIFYQTAYREAFKEVNLKYDIEKELALTLKAMKNMPGWNDKYNDTINRSLKNNQKKVEALDSTLFEDKTAEDQKRLDRNGEKLFGFPNKINTEIDAIDPVIESNSAEQNENPSPIEDRSDDVEPDKPKAEYFSEDENLNKEIQKDIEASEKKENNGEYSKKNEREKIKKKGATKKPKFFPLHVSRVGINDVKEWRKTLKEKTKEFLDFMKSRNYVTFDIEASYSTENYPLAEPRILDFSYKSTDNSKAWSRRIVPEYPHQYELAITANGENKYQHYSFFRNTGDTAQNYSQIDDNGAVYFTQNGYDELIERVKVTNDNFSDYTFTSYFGEGLDFTILKENNALPEKTFDMKYPVIWFYDKTKRSRPIDQDGNPRMTLEYVYSDMVKYNDKNGITDIQEAEDIKAHNASSDIDMLNYVMQTIHKYASKNQVALDTDIKAMNEKLTVRELTTEDMGIFRELGNLDNSIKLFLRKYGITDLRFGSRSVYVPAADMIVINDSIRTDPEQMRKDFLHEMYHKYTVAYMEKNKIVNKDGEVIGFKDKNLQYMWENFESIHIRGAEIAANMDDKVMAERLGKISRNEKNKYRAFAEFVAMMKAEPDFVESLKKEYKKKDRTWLSHLYRVLRKIGDFFRRSRKDVVNFDEVVIASAAVARAGDQYNLSNPEDAAKKRLSFNEEISELKYDTSKTARENLDDATYYTLNKIYKNVGFRKGIPGLDLTVRAVNDRSAIAVNMLLDRGIEPLTIKGLKAADKWLSKHSVIYVEKKKATTDFFDENSFIQKMKIYLNPSLSGDAYSMSKLQTIQMLAHQDVTAFKDRVIKKLNNLMDEAELNGKKITDLDKSKLNDVIANAPLFYLINLNNDYITLLESSNRKDTLNSLVLKYEGTILNKDVKSSIYNISQYLSKKDNVDISTSSAYNLTQLGLDSKTIPYARALLALYTLQNVDDIDTGFDILKQNKDLGREFKGLSNSLYELGSQVMNGTNEQYNFRENLVYEQFEDPKEFRVVNEHDLNSETYSLKKGWKVLRKPTAHDYGVVWRDRSKIVTQEGAGISENYKYYDIMVPLDRTKPYARNAIKLHTGTKTVRHKVVLTNKELQSFEDYISDPIENLVRSYANLLQIQKTQEARDYVLYGDKLELLETTNISNQFNTDLGSISIKQRPWFLKIPKNKTAFEFLNENPNIAKYYQIPEQLSRINGFNNNIDLVRIDLHDQLVGYKEPILFESNKLLRNMAYTVRQLVTMVKLHWVSANPKKIANDAISNNLVLLSFNINPIMMAKYQTRGVKLAAEMSKMRTDYIDLSFQLLSYGDDQKYKNEKKITENKMKILEKKMENHEMAPLVKNGMIQSISTELFRKDESVISGLQKDVENIFNMFLKTNDGNPSDIAKAIKIFANFGYSVDDIILFAGKNIKNAKFLGDFGKYAGENIEYSGKRIKDKKKVGDMAKYLSEFVASPDSELIKFGSYLTQMIDVSSRYTLYRYLMETRKEFDPDKRKYVPLSEEKIINIVLESFIDYKVNMPKELKVLSDYGVLLFPSFWMRVQKLIISQSKRNPAKVASGLVLQEILGIHVPSYFDSNIIEKVDYIFNMPPAFTDPLTALFPTELF